MITLFKSDETNFDHNGLGSLDKNILETVVEEKLNGLYSFVFKYPIFAPHGSEIDGQSVIRVPTPDGNQLFRVYNPIKSMGYLTIKTYHIFYDLADNIIEDTNIVSKNGQGAITQLGGATQYSHSFRFFSDIETTTNARMVRMNPVAALIDDEEDNTFISRWGGELKRNNFDVRMNKSIGTNRGKKIQHRKDLIGYEADVDWSTAVTRIMPKGFDGLLLPEKYVDSPLINHYVKPKIKVVEYSDIKAAVGEYANDKDAVPLQTAYQLLRERANEEYFVNKVDIPEATYKVDFVSLDQTEEYKDLQELQQVFLGDTVTVIHKEDGLNIEAKVISYKYDPLVKKYLGLELGSFKETFTSKYSDITKLTRKVTELVQTTNFIQSTADGKNTINRGTDEPLNPNVNDLWYKPNGSETELWQYVDENGQIFWKMISSTAELNTVKAEVDKAIQQADTDRAKVEQDIDQALTDAQDYTNQKANEFDNKLTAVNQSIATVTQSANDAVNKADKAIEDVGFMKVDVDAAKVNAIDALTQAQTATDNVSTLSFSVDELTKTVGFKADSTMVDNISGLVDQHSNLIEANAQAITARLTSAQIETLLTGKKYVNETTLNATANGLSTSITQVSTDLSNLEVGATNLIPDSQKIQTQPNNTGKGTAVRKTDELIPYYTITATTGNTISVYEAPIFAWMTNNAIVGNTYTIGVDVRLPSSGSVRFMANGSNSSVLANKWTRIFYTFVYSTSLRVGGFVYGGTTMDYRNWKLETGNKATDWSPAPEDMATLEKFTTLETTVNGINTVVGTKADQSQITQLAGQISSKVESATYNSKMTQLDSAINLRVTKGDVTAQINIEAGVTLISNKKLLLDANTYIMGTTFANDVKAKSLEAVYADIATLKTKVLTANVIDSIMIKSDTALITKLFATDANVNVLTAKTAFINSVKAIDISADRVTAGTLNAANVNIINLNANAITAGTINGANSSWNLNTGVLETRLAGTTTKATLDGGRITSYSDRYGTAELNGGRIEFDDGTYRLGVNPLNLYFAKGNNIRNIFWNSEGLSINPGPFNLGTDKNTSLHLIGGGTGSHQYIQFSDNATNGILQRITALDRTLWIQHANNSGRVEISNYNRDEFSGDLYLGSMIIKDANGNGLRLVNNRIENVNRTGTRDVMISPAGKGNLIVKDPQGTWYGIHAYALYNQSSRKIKTNIVDYNGSGLEAVNRLNVVEYNMKQDLARGINERKIGLIAEDSPLISASNGESIDTYALSVLNAKAIQEIDKRILSETGILKARVEALEKQIEQESGE